MMVGFPESAVLIVPGPEDRPQLCSEDNIVFYEFPFRNGFTYPFSPLAKKVLETFDLNPG